VQRKIVRIDEEKCNGCGVCLTACHEGALHLVNGKARLVADAYCDGLGACLPECPTGAITIEEREAAAFDAEAVKKHLEARPQSQLEKLACGCSGTQARLIVRDPERAHPPAAPAVTAAVPGTSQLRQWPCQIRLVPANAPYLNHTHLLIAADCTAYAYANFHQDFMRNKITLIGCPKLDDFNYTAKLTDILKVQEIKSLTILRMEVPCCGGIVNVVKEALINSGKMLPWQIITISTNGSIVEA
jgi:ferredoxin